MFVKVAYLCIDFINSISLVTRKRVPVLLSKHSVILIFCYSKLPNTVYTFTHCISFSFTHLEIASSTTVLCVISNALYHHSITSTTLLHITMWGRMLPHLQQDTTQLISNTSYLMWSSIIIAKSRRLCLTRS